jgi:hypothetical protein
MGSSPPTDDAEYGSDDNGETGELSVDEEIELLQ